MTQKTWDALEKEHDKISADMNSVIERLYACDESGDRAGVAKCLTELEGLREAISRNTAEAFTLFAKESR